MFIPVGLIGRMLVDAREQDQAMAMHHAGLMADQERLNARSYQMWNACTGPDACLVAMGGADWPATAVDGVSVYGHPSTQASGGYRDAGDGLGPGPHGFFGVSPGRHTVATMVMGRAVMRSFVLFPREAYFLRVDYPTATWASFDAPGQRAILDRAGRADLTLFDYNAMVVGRLVAANAIRSYEEAMTDAVRYVKEALHAAALGDAMRRTNSVELAARSLSGAPIHSFEPITSLVGFHAFEHLGKGKMASARVVVDLGLALLPEHPTLLGVLGELQLREGKTEEGRATLGRAMEREAGLDDRLRTRVRELLA